MKKIFAAFLIFGMAFFFGCGTFGKIVVEKDEFKDATTVSMDYRYKATSWRAVGSYLTINYFRMIKAGKKQVVEMNFNMTANDDVTSLQPKAFIKAGEDKLELPISKMTVEAKSQTDIETKVEGKSGGGAYVDYTGMGTGNTTTVKSETSSSTRRWKELKGKIVLTTGMEEAILKNKKVMMRFYVDNKPVSYIIEEGDLTKLKTYLRHNGAIKK